MKINQLFVKDVTIDVFMKVIECFGLTGLSDRRFFSKIDMQRNETVRKLTLLVPELRDYYLPCKAKLYLNSVTEKRAITIFKQLLKLFSHVLLSRERNSRHRKIILYQVVSFAERQAVQRVEVRRDVSVKLDFD
jgi:hypothetical protein